MVFLAAFSFARLHAKQVGANSSIAQLQRPSTLSSAHSRAAYWIGAFQSIGRKP
jgi:hypothetical protein